MVSRAEFPDPSAYSTWQDWAGATRGVLEARGRDSERVEPKVILLEHRTQLSRATTDGILMFDKAIDQVIVSIDGQWRIITVGGPA